MHSSMLALAIIVLTVSVPTICGIGSSCNFRCNVQPMLIDHLYPSGCYCHSTCGGKLRCCYDKSRYCGSRGSGGSQACMVPPKVRNADVVGMEKLFYRRGEQITYECKFRYVMDGRSTRTCIRNNIWSPGPPKCNYETFVCRPPRVSNGDYSVKKKQYLNLESVTIWCNNGYELQGPSRITCRYFSWSGPYTRCIKDQCATMTCSADATCTNSLLSSRCKCNDGFEGDGHTCTRIPCYKHACRADENCVDDGRGDGQYKCECKKGLKRMGSKCVADPCINNDCHENAICTDLGSTYECACKQGFIGNGTNCEEQTYEPAQVEGEGVDNTTECEERCYNATTLRERNVCVHTKCNGGEVCGENSRVPTVCTEKQCFENTDSDGFTVNASDKVHCLDSEGMKDNTKNCCWVGE